MIRALLRVTFFKRWPRFAGTGARRWWVPFSSGIFAADTPALPSCTASWPSQLRVSRNTTRAGVV